MYLIWGILNLGLFAYFIVACFKVAKLLRERIGSFASTIFMFGLLSYMDFSNNSSADKKYDSTSYIWDFQPTDSLGTSETVTKIVRLEDNLVTKYDLCVRYKYDEKTKLNIPVSAYSKWGGVLIGTNWQPFLITLNNTTDPKKFNYSVEGIVGWKLLGATVYTQAKSCDGVLTLP